MYIYMIYNNKINLNAIEYYINNYYIYIIK
jgi:hypothetical protein